MVDDRVQPPHQLAAGRPVIDAQQQVGSGVRRRPLVQGSALDVVELEADALPHWSRASPILVVLGRFGRVRVRRRQVREGLRGRPSTTGPRRRG